MIYSKLFLRHGIFLAARRSFWCINPKAPIPMGQSTFLVLIVLNQYARRYWVDKPDKVISWIETMSQSEKIQKLSSDRHIELIESLETFIRHFIERHLTRIKQEPSLKNKVLKILNYLMNNDSKLEAWLPEDLKEGLVNP